MIIAVLSTGCAGQSKVTVTTEQNDLIAEYAAGVLLKYSYENEWNYTKLRNAKIGSNISQNATIGSKGSTTSPTIAGSSTTQTKSATTETKSSTVETKSSTASVTTTSSDPMVSLAEGLGISGAKIKYSSYVAASTYPQGSLVLSVPATTGKKVVAIEFEISNPTATPIVCNTTSNKINMKLLVNGSTEVSESFTILQNDLINLKNITINTNDKYTAVAIYMVPENIAESITSLSVSVSLNGTSAVTQKLF